MTNRADSPEAIGAGRMRLLALFESPARKRGIKVKLAERVWRLQLINREFHLEPWQQPQNAAPRYAIIDAWADVQKGENGPELYHLFGVKCPHLWGDEGRRDGLLTFATALEVAARLLQTDESPQAAAARRAWNQSREAYLR